MRKIFAASVVLAGAICCAEEASVVERFKFGTSATVAATTISVTAEPELPVPLFHFDTGRTEGWTFSANGKKVVKIPSLSGSRYLKAGDGTAEANGIDGGSWVGADNVHKEPDWALDETLGAYVIDFGSRKNYNGMLFDPVDFSEAGDGSALTNILQGIGTVVAVWYSSPDMNGGYFLGGGNPAFGDSESFQKCNWARYDAYLGFLPAAYAYAAPVFHSRSRAGGATVWHDGQATAGKLAGFKGCWEVVTVQPETAANEASGVGCAGGRHQSGEFKVAEMYIFGELLSEEKISELEAWLRRKWFGDTLPGFNGDAVIGEIRANSNNNGHVAARVTLDVPQGSTLTVDSLRGGHGGGGAYVKKGEGTLRARDASTYDGAIAVEEGDLDLTRRKVPSFDELPHGMTVRFDASDPDCFAAVEENGVEYVTCLSNLVENMTYCTTNIYARPERDDLRPWIIRNALGENKHAFDFGPFTYAGNRAEYDGRLLKLTMKKSGDFVQNDCALHVSTAVAVIGAQRGGGHLLGDYNGGDNSFRRAAEADAHMVDESWYRHALFANGGIKGNNILNIQKHGTIHINGIRRKTSEGYMTPGWQVVALQSVGGTVHYIGGYWDQRAGGMRIAEIMLFSRVLSDRELRDVQAYLYYKWFGGYTPGYGPAPEGRPHVHNLEAAGSGTVTVEGDVPVRAASVTGAGRLAKKGAGTLEIESANAEGTIAVSEGTVRVAAPSGVSEKCEMAKGACLHLDASDAATLEAPYKMDVLERVKYWHDKSGRGNVAFSSELANTPRLNNEDTCNGLPVIDFGEYDTPTSAAMGIARAIDSARAVYVVWGTQNGGGHLFGFPRAHWTYEFENNTDTQNWVDFTRRGTATKNPGGDVGVILDYQSSAQTVATGTIYTNGVQTVFSAVPTGDYQLFEFHTGEPAAIAGINQDRGYYRGGGRYGEIIVFDRELSPRERISTRNYLLKKWFGKSEMQLEPLPAEEARPVKLSVSVEGGAFEASGAALDGNFSYADGSTMTIAFDATGTVTNMPSLTGTLSFGENMNVVFAGPEGYAPAPGTMLRFPATGDVAGIDAINVADFSGLEFTHGTMPHFRKGPATGRLMMTFGRTGLRIIVR